MTGGTHAERITGLLARTPGLDDDEIATALAIEPRQTVNQVCRRLAGCGVLQREPGPSGKIINRLSAGHEAAVSIGAQLRGRLEATRLKSPTAGSRPEVPLTPADFARTLLILPCSGAKQNLVGACTSGPSIANSLPDELASELVEARRQAAERIQIDETILIPAWQRYDGSLYRSGRDALRYFLDDGAHIIILSGGYGVVLATEPIGQYDTVLKPSWWPGGIIERVLIAYAQRHDLTSVRAFASATGPYITMLHRLRWRDAGIEDALILTPRASSGGMRKSPASQGEALAALRDGSLITSWQSSYGLTLDVHSA